MQKILLKKSLVIAIILLTSSIFSPLLTADNLFDKDVLVSFTLYGKQDVIDCKAILSYEESIVINNFFKELQYNITYHPFSDETQRLKSCFVEFLDEKGLLPNSISKDQIIESMTPPNLYQLLQNKLFKCFLPSPKISSTKGTAFFCSVASGGSGKTTPIVIAPRPHIIVFWKGGIQEELSVTTVGGIHSGKGFIAAGNQNGMMIGFEGLGLTYGTPFGTVYGFTGYAVYASVTADLIEFYPPNSKPEISNPNPSDGQENIPTSLSELSFQINDDDNELMDYSVTTDPFIGSGSKNSVGDGIYVVSVDGLQPSTTYIWTVAVTDGKDTTTNIFSFTTIQERPIVTNPVPFDRSSISTDLSELSFTLTDIQGDKMDYTVETSPDIGSDSATNVGNGVYSMQIDTLEENIWYYWFVNVTDGEHWTKEKFNFYTGDLDLVGYWSFNDGTANDISGNKNHGTKYGVKYLSSGGPDGSGCFSFDGVDDYISINDVSDFRFVNQDLSFCCWVTILDNIDDYRYFITLTGTDGSYPGVVLEKCRSGLKGGRILMQTRGTPDTKAIVQSIEDGDTLPKNKWMFVVGVVDYPNSVKLYIDGVLQESVSAIDFDLTQVDNLKLYFGWLPYDMQYWGPHYGKIDEVFIYGNALSEQEIQLLYESYSNK